jgi:hypothetical protein
VVLLAAGLFAGSGDSPFLLRHHALALWRRARPTSRQDRRAAGASHICRAKTTDAKIVAIVPRKSQASKSRSSTHTATCMAQRRAAFPLPFVNGGRSGLGCRSIRFSTRLTAAGPGRNPLNPLSAVTVGAPTSILSAAKCLCAAGRIAVCRKCSRSHRHRVGWDRLPSG